MYQLLLKKGHARKKKKNYKKTEIRKIFNVVNTALKQMLNQVYSFSLCLYNYFILSYRTFLQDRMK